MKRYFRIPMLRPACVFVLTLCMLPAHADLPEPGHVLVTDETEASGVSNAPERYAQYREQNIVVTNASRIVCIAQGRDPSQWSDRRAMDLVVRTSEDSGETWPITKLVVETEFAYSSLILLPDGNAGLIYETRNHRDIDLVTFPLSWLFDETE